MTPQNSPVLASTVSFNEGLLRLAAVHGKTVEFTYVKSASEAPAKRRLVPDAVYDSRDENRVFVGTDPDRDGLRSYRLDRIAGEARIA